MPNIASLLKAEIVRLARKEVRKETTGLKKASAQYRSEIAALKRRLATSERQVAAVGKLAAKAAPDSVPEEGGLKIRFSGKGLAKHRQRLGLSAAEMGLLLEVSSQTIYNWETGKTRPRQEQLAAISALRRLGKRKALAQLAQMAEQAE